MIIEVIEKKNKSKVHDNNNINVVDEEDMEEDVDEWKDDDWMQGESGYAITSFDCKKCDEIFETGLKLRIHLQEHRRNGWNFLL